MILQVRVGAGFAAALRGLTLHDAIALRGLGVESVNSFLNSRTWCWRCSSFIRARWRPVKRGGCHGAMQRGFNGSGGLHW